MAYEVIGIDTSNPQNPVEKWRFSLSKKASFNGYALSPDARFFAVFNEGRQIEIYLVQNSTVKLFKTISDNNKQFRYGDRMYFSPAGNLLIVINLNIHSNEISAYRVDSDEKIDWWSGEPNICISAISQENHLVALTDKGLGVFKIADHFPKVGVMTGELNHFNCKALGINDKNELYMETGGAQLVRINLENPSRPFINGRWPSELYGKMLGIGGHNFAYVGFKAGLGVIDLNQMRVSAQGLKEAHRTALTTYKATDKPKNYFEAIYILEKAGVSVALASLPEGLDKVEASQIFNDYGFFLLSRRYKLNKDVNIAIQAIKRAIELDSGRDIAYLNLGDALRYQLDTSDNFDAKLDLTRDIIDNYAKYVSRGGKLPKRAADFLAMNLVANPPKDICSTVVNYANAGRLSELFGSGASVDFETKGNVRLDIKVEGTAYCSSIYAYDANTNEPVKKIVLPNYAFTCRSEQLALIPFIDGYYLLIYNLNPYPIKLFPIGKSKGQGCEFTTISQEIVSLKSKDPSLCRLLQTSKRPKLLNFDSTDEVHEEAVQEVEEKYSWTNVEGARRIDFNNDGKKEMLLKLHLSSGASVGCGADFYELMDDKGLTWGDEKKRALLRKIQGISDGNRFYVSVCDATSGWFVYKKQVYFENKSNDIRNRVHDVWKTKNGESQRVCEFDYETVTEMQ